MAAGLKSECYSCSAFVLLASDLIERSDHADTWSLLLFILFYATAIILLSFVLALGFLLIILSCALWSNWLPLLVALIYVLTPLPNSLCARCAGADDFSADYNSGFLDFGNFMTGLMIVSGFALPLSLAHAGVIAPTACWMSIAGGGLVYATILTYSGFFSETDDY